MSARAKAVRTLYRAKRITLEGVHQAVGSLITPEEYKIITGEDYAG